MFRSHDYIKHSKLCVLKWTMADFATVLENA